MTIGPVEIPEHVAPAPAAAAVIAPEAPEWEVVPNDDAAWTTFEGWSHEFIVETQRAKWASFLKSVEASRPLGQSHEAAADAAPDYATHNTLMTFGYVLGRAAVGRTRLSVLDWGGGLGHYSVYARKLLPEMTFDYVVKDLPALCAAASLLLPEATFVSDDDAALSRRYDLVFASGALHYVRDHYGLLGRMCASADKWIMVTRLPIVEVSDDFLVMQRPYKYGYLTEYPGWFLNRDRLLAFMSAKGFDLDRQFLVAEQPYVPNAPEQAQYYGFLFRRVERASSKSAIET